PLPLDLCCCIGLCCVFSFNAPATPQIYTLSLHDAFPISAAVALGDDQVERDVARMLAEFRKRRDVVVARFRQELPGVEFVEPLGDRKSTRLNSSHGSISYAVFCLKKKNQYHNAGT